MAFYPINQQASQSYLRLVALSNPIIEPDFHALQKTISASTSSSQSLLQLFASQLATPWHLNNLPDLNSFYSAFNQAPSVLLADREPQPTSFAARDDSGLAAATTHAISDPTWLQLPFHHDKSFPNISSFNVQRPRQAFIFARDVGVFEQAHDHSLVSENSAPRCPSAQCLASAQQHVRHAVRYGTTAQTEASPDTCSNVPSSTPPQSTGYPLPIDGCSAESILEQHRLMFGGCLCGVVMLVFRDLWADNVTPTLISTLRFRQQYSHELKEIQQRQQQRSSSQIDQEPGDNLSSLDSQENDLSVPPSTAQSAFMKHLESPTHEAMMLLPLQLQKGDIFHIKGARFSSIDLNAIHSSELPPRVKSVTRSFIHPVFLHHILSHSSLVDLISGAESPAQFAKNVISRTLSCYPSLSRSPELGSSLSPPPHSMTEQQPTSELNATQVHNSTEPSITQPGSTPNTSLTCPSSTMTPNSQPPPQPQQQNLTQSFFRTRHAIFSTLENSLHAFLVLIHWQLLYCHPSITMKNDDDRQSFTPPPFPPILTIDASSSLIVAPHVIIQATSMGKASECLRAGFISELCPRTTQQSNVLTTQSFGRYPKLSHDDVPTHPFSNRLRVEDPRALLSQQYVLSAFYTDNRISTASYSPYASIWPDLFRFILKAVLFNWADSTQSLLDASPRLHSAILSWLVQQKYMPLPRKFSLSTTDMQENDDAGAILTKIDSPTDRISWSLRQTGQSLSSKFVSHVTQQIITSLSEDSSTTAPIPSPCSLSELYSYLVSWYISSFVSDQSSVPASIQCNQSVLASIIELYLQHHLFITNQSLHQTLSASCQLSRGDSGTSWAAIKGTIYHDLVQKTLGQENAGLAAILLRLNETCHAHCMEIVSLQSSTVMTAQAEFDAMEHTLAHQIALFQRSIPSKQPQEQQINENKNKSEAFRQGINSFLVAHILDVCGQLAVYSPRNNVSNQTVSLSSQDNNTLALELPSVQLNPETGLDSIMTDAVSQLLPQLHIWAITFSLRVFLTTYPQLASMSQTICQNSLLSTLSSQIQQQTSSNTALNNINTNHNNHVVQILNEISHPAERLLAQRNIHLFLQHISPAETPFSIFGAPSSEQSVLSPFYAMRGRVDALAHALLFPEKNSSQSKPSQSLMKQLSSGNSKSPSSLPTNGRFDTIFSSQNHNFPALFSTPSSSVPLARTSVLSGNSNSIPSSQNDLPSIATHHWALKHFRSHLVPIEIKSSAVRQTSHYTQSIIYNIILDELLSFDMPFDPEANPSISLFSPPKKPSTASSTPKMSLTCDETFNDPYSLDASLQIMRARAAMINCPSLTSHDNVPVDHDIDKRSLQCQYHLSTRAYLWYLQPRFGSQYQNKKAAQLAAQNAQYLSQQAKPIRYYSTTVGHHGDEIRPQPSTMSQLQFLSPNDPAQKTTDTLTTVDSTLFPFSFLKPSQSDPSTPINVCFRYLAAYQSSSPLIESNQPMTFFDNISTPISRQSTLILTKDDESPISSESYSQAKIPSSTPNASSHMVRFYHNVQLLLNMVSSLQHSLMMMVSSPHRTPTGLISQPTMILSNDDDSPTSSAFVTPPQTSCTPAHISPHIQHLLRQNNSIALHHVYHQITSSVLSPQNQQHPQKFSLPVSLDICHHQFNDISITHSKSSTLTQTISTGGFTTPPVLDDLITPDSLASQPAFRSCQPPQTTTVSQHIDSPPAVIGSIDEPTIDDMTQFAPGLGYFFYSRMSNTVVHQLLLQRNRLAVALARLDRGGPDWWKTTQELQARLHLGTGQPSGGRRRSKKSPWGSYYPVPTILQDFYSQHYNNASGEHDSPGQSSQLLYSIKVSHPSRHFYQQMRQEHLAKYSLDDASWTYLSTPNKDESNEIDIEDLGRCVPSQLTSKDVLSSSFFLPSNSPISSQSKPSALSIIHNTLTMHDTFNPLQVVGILPEFGISVLPPPLPRGDKACKWCYVANICNAFELLEKNATMLIDDSELPNSLIADVAANPSNSDPAQANPSELNPIEQPPALSVCSEPFHLGLSSTLSNLDLSSLLVTSQRLHRHMYDAKVREIRFAVQNVWSSLIESGSSYSTVAHAIFGHKQFLFPAATIHPQTLVPLNVGTDESIPAVHTTLSSIHDSNLNDFFDDPVDGELNVPSKSLAQFDLVVSNIEITPLKVNYTFSTYGSLYQQYLDNVAEQKNDLQHSLSQIEQELNVATSLAQSQQSTSSQPIQRKSLYSRVVPSQSVTQTPRILQLNEQKKEVLASLRQLGSNIGLPTPTVSYQDDIDHHYSVGDYLQLNAEFLGDICRRSQHEYIWPTPWYPNITSTRKPEGTSQRLDDDDEEEQQQEDRETAGEPFIQNPRFWQMAAGRVISVSSSSISISLASTHDLIDPLSNYLSKLSIFKPHLLRTSKHGLFPTNQPDTLPSITSSSIPNNFPWLLWRFYPSIAYSVSFENNAAIIGPLLLLPTVWGRATIQSPYIADPFKTQTDESSHSTTVTTIHTAEPLLDISVPSTDQLLMVPHELYSHLENLLLTYQQHRLHNAMDLISSAATSDGQIYPIAMLPDTFSMPQEPHLIKPFSQSVSVSQSLTSSLCAVLSDGTPISQLFPTFPVIFSPQIMLRQIIIHRHISPLVQSFSLKPYHDQYRCLSQQISPPPSLAHLLHQITTKYPGVTPYVHSQPSIRLLHVFAIAFGVHFDFIWEVLHDPTRFFRFSPASSSSGPSLERVKNSIAELLFARSYLCQIPFDPLYDHVAAHDNTLSQLDCHRIGAQIILSDWFITLLFTHTYLELHKSDSQYENLSIYLDFYAMKMTVISYQNIVKWAKYSFQYQSQSSSVSSASLSHPCPFVVFPYLTATSTLTHAVLLQLNAQQQLAFFHSLITPRWNTIVGLPGSGKSFLIALVLQAFIGQGLRIALTSCTNFAVRSLLDRIVQNTPSKRSICLWPSTDMYPNLSADAVQAAPSTAHCLESFTLPPLFNLSSLVVRFGGSSASLSTPLPTITTPSRNVSHSSDGSSFTTPNAVSSPSSPSHSSSTPRGFYSPYCFNLASERNQDPNALSLSYFLDIGRLYWAQQTNQSTEATENDDTPASPKLAFSSQLSAFLTSITVQHCQIVATTLHSWSSAMSTLGWSWWGSAMFDLVVFEEASQIPFSSALPAMSTISVNGKWLFVGDPYQLSPLVQNLHIADYHHRLPWSNPMNNLASVENPSILPATCSILDYFLPPTHSTPPVEETVDSEPNFSTLVSPELSLTSRTTTLGLQYRMNKEIASLSTGVYHGLLQCATASVSTKRLTNLCSLPIAQQWIQQLIKSTSNHCSDHVHASSSYHSITEHQNNSTSELAHVSTIPSSEVRAVPSLSHSNSSTFGTDSLTHSIRTSSTSSSSSSSLYKRRKISSTVQLSDSSPQALLSPDTIILSTSHSYSVLHAPSPSPPSLTTPPHPVAFSWLWACLQPNPPVIAINTSCLGDVGFDCQSSTISQSLHGFPTGSYNPMEALICLQLTVGFLLAGVPSHEIIIITPFRDQRAYIISLFQNFDQSQHGVSCQGGFFDNISLSSISVYTIDQSQGLDVDIVLISSVLSCPTVHQATIRQRAFTPHNYHLLSDTNRATVALTRARKKFIIISNWETLSRGFFSCTMKPSPNVHIDNSDSVSCTTSDPPFEVFHQHNQQFVECTPRDEAWSSECVQLWTNSVYAGAFAALVEMNQCLHLTNMESDHLDNLWQQLCFDQVSRI